MSAANHFGALSMNHTSPDWHHGPTDKDPDPGKRRHTGCGGEVLGFKEGDICSKCSAGDDYAGELEQDAARYRHLMTLHAFQLAPMFGVTYGNYTPIEEVIGKVSDAIDRAMSKIASKQEKNYHEQV